jgi:hypothetical protein
VFGTAPFRIIFSPLYNKIAAHAPRLLSVWQLPSVYILITNLSISSRFKSYETYVLYLNLKVAQMTLNNYNSDDLVHESAMRTIY